MDSLGVFFIKLLVLAVISPLWLPFIKAVWEEMNLAMAEEGGVFGRTPKPERLREIQIEKSLRPDPLVNEPWMTNAQRREGRRGMGGRETSATPSPGQAPTRRGF